LPEDLPHDLREPKKGMRFPVWDRQAPDKPDSAVVCRKLEAHRSVSEPPWRQEPEPALIPRV